MGERKWFQVERNKISSYICTAVLPRREHARDSAAKCCERQRCRWGVPARWRGYEAASQGSRAVRGTRAYVLKDCMKPWARSLPAADLF